MIEQPRRDPHTQPGAPDTDVLLAQYQLMVDTYLKYLEITLKFTLFSYAVTGGILSYCLAHPAERLMIFGPWFLLLMNLFFALCFFIAAYLVKPVFDEVRDVSVRLHLGACPEVRFLTIVLFILGVLYLLIVAGLAVLIRRF